MGKVTLKPGERQGGAERSPKPKAERSVRPTDLDLKPSSAAGKLCDSGQGVYSSLSLGYRICTMGTVVSTSPRVVVSIRNTRVKRLMLEAEGSCYCSSFLMIRAELWAGWWRGEREPSGTMGFICSIFSTPSRRSMREEARTSLDSESAAPAPPIAASRLVLIP